MQSGRTERVSVSYMQKGLDEMAVIGPFKNDDVDL